MPQAAASLIAGGISNINVTAQGGPYNVAPTVVISDPTGTGAEGVASMIVTAISVPNPGLGYNSPPPVILTPFFKSMVPDSAPTATQQAVLASFMKNGFDTALKISTLASPPAIS